MSDVELIFDLKFKENNMITVLKPELTVKNSQSVKSGTANIKRRLNSN